MFTQTITNIIDDVQERTLVLNAKENTVCFTMINKATDDKIVMNIGIDNIKSILLPAIDTMIKEASVLKENVKSTKNIENDNGFGNIVAKSGKKLVVKEFMWR